MSPDGGTAEPSTRLQRIAVAGNPNSGKTSIFNHFTGLRHKVGNYPGVTVEKREGSLSDSDVVLLDLPGAYSLSARSPDEEIARDVLLGRVAGTPRPDAVLLVLDAANLERNLYLASQILEFGMPVVIACNMMDVAEQRGCGVDCDGLARNLGVPVVPTTAKTGSGMKQLRTELLNVADRDGYSRPWRLPEPFEDALAEAESVLTEARATPPRSVTGGALLWLTDYVSGEVNGRTSAERFLKRLSPEHAERLRAAGRALASRDADAAATAIERRYAWISRVADAVRQQPGDGIQTSESLTDRIDQVLTHRVWGLTVFVVVMFALFLSIFSWAEPLMDLIEAGQQTLSTWVDAMLPKGPVQSLVTDGIIVGVGSVLIFFPQICILFLFLSILEDSGYMARAAFLMDRLMARVGLHGRSFVPLLSGYACAIPGIMAARTIENPKDRLVTILVTPLMSCSARLPVYIIVIAAAFGDRLWLKAGVMLGLYALGTLMALAAAMIFKKTLLKGPRPTFIMELPPYHMPRLGAIVRTVWDRSRLFLTGAGTMIFAASVVIWALTYFPRLDESNLSAGAAAQITQLTPGDTLGRENILAGAQLRQSYLGRLGRTIEPAIEPLGYDWRLGVGILSSFLAREVFVSTMGITFSLGEADESSIALRESLAGAQWPDGTTVLTPLTGVGLMVFYVLACQCISTLALTRRETRSWRWPAFMFCYMTTLAYVAALGVYQIGHWIGLG